MGKTIPNKLYKYRPWDDFTKEIILENKLYFSCADDFNDPFDCSVNLKMDGTKKQWSNEVIKTKAQTLGRNLSHKERKIICNAFDLKQMSHVKKEMVEELTKRLKKTMGICCFSSCKDNILMWSHYADNHKGVCLIFSSKDMHAARKVNYEINYPNVSYFNDDEEKKVNARYFTKAINWKYEDEYRVVVPNFARQKIKFPPESLTGVIIGCCMPDKDIEELSKILKNSVIPIMLYRAEKKNCQFGLSIEPIKRYGTENN